MELPPLDPDDERTPVGVILHPDTWPTIREAAREVGRGIKDAFKYPLVGLSEAVGRGQVAVVYDLQAMREELQEEGFHLTEPPDEG